MTELTDPACLNVAYFGQVGKGADENNNDCGAAGVKSVGEFAGATMPVIDTIYNEVMPSGDVCLSVGNLLASLARRGVKCEWDAGYSLKDLWETLANGSPTIALIRYGALSTIRPNRFTGSHLVTVIGADITYFYIHDPLNNVSSGAHVAVPIKMWWNAWTTVGDDNPQSSMITLLNVGYISPQPFPIKTVVPNDTNGCYVRKIPGLMTEANKVYGIPYRTSAKSIMNVYIECDGWGKISLTQERWVCMEYTKEIISICPSARSLCRWAEL